MFYYFDILIINYTYLYNFST